MSDNTFVNILRFGLLLGLAFSAGFTQANRNISYTYNAMGQVETLDGPRIDVDDITNSNRGHPQKSANVEIPEHPKRSLPQYHPYHIL